MEFDVHLRGTGSLADGNFKAVLRIRIREPGCGNQDPGTGNRDPGTGIGEPGSGNRDSWSGNRDPGSDAFLIRDPGSGMYIPDHIFKS